MNKFEVPITEKTNLEERLTMYILSSRNPREISTMYELSGNKPMTAAEISESLSISKEIIYKHLLKMRGEGLIYVKDRVCAPGSGQRKSNAWDLNEFIRCNYKEVIKEYVDYEQGEYGEYGNLLIPELRDGMRESKIIKNTTLEERLTMYVLASEKLQIKRIIATLSESKTVKQIAGDLDLPESSIYQYLTKMIKKGFVHYIGEGRRRGCKLALDEHIVPYRAVLIEYVDYEQGKHDHLTLFPEPDIKFPENPVTHEKLLEIFQDGEKHCLREVKLRLRATKSSLSGPFERLIRENKIEMVGIEPRPQEFYKSRSGRKEVKMYKKVG